MQRRKERSWDFLKRRRRKKLKINGNVHRRLDPPEVAFHLVPTVLQLALDVQRQFVAVGLQQVVVEVEQLAGVLSADAGWQRGRDEQRDVVRWAAVRDHLPIEDAAVVVVAVVELALEQQVVAPEVGVRDEAHRFGGLEELLDQILRLRAQLLEHLQFLLVAAFLLQEFRQLWQALLQQLLITLGGFVDLEEKLNRDDNHHIRPSARHQTHRILLIQVDLLLELHAQR